MAGSAVFRRIYLPVLLDLLAHHVLHFAVIFGLVFQIGDFRHRTQSRFWIAVTFQTPAHTLILVVEDHWHFRHITVTANAGNPAANVHAVVEVGVIRHLVDLHPLHGLACFHALLDGSQVRRIGLDVLVTVPTSGTRGHVGMTALLHETVAVTAIHTELPGVNFMRERHGLIRLISHPSILLGEIIRYPQRDASPNGKEGDKELQRKGISPAWKEISHSVSRLIGACEKFHKQEF